MSSTARLRTAFTRKLAVVALAAALPASLLAIASAVSATEADAPSGITLTSRGNGTLTVSWTAPSGDSIAYDVAYSSDNAQSWTRAATEMTGTSLTISGPEGTTGNNLDDKATYTVAVRSQDMDSSYYSQWVNSGQFSPAPTTTTTLAPVISSNYNYNYNSGNVHSNTTQASKKTAQATTPTTTPPSEPANQAPANNPPTYSNMFTWDSHLTASVSSDPDDPDDPNDDTTKYDLTLRWSGDVDPNDTDITYRVKLRTDSDWSQERVINDIARTATSYTITDVLDKQGSYYAADAFVIDSGYPVGQQLRDERDIDHMPALVHVCRHKTNRTMRTVAQSSDCNDMEVHLEQVCVLTIDGSEGTGLYWESSYNNWVLCENQAA